MSSPHRPAQKGVYVLRKAAVETSGQSPYCTPHPGDSSSSSREGSDDKAVRAHDLINDAVMDAVRRGALRGCVSEGRVSGVKS